MKAVRAVAETDDLKCVKIVDTEIVETLYSMDEDFFLANATPVEPRKSANPET